MCKKCYMREGRAAFKAKSASPKAFDYDSYWEFVKKELKIG